MVNYIHGSDGLSINGSAEVILETISAITVTGAITGTGTLSSSGFSNVSLSGDWGIANFTPGSSTVLFSGQGDEVVNIVSTNSNKTFYNLIISINVTITDSPAAGLEITQALTITEDAVLNLGNNFTHSVGSTTTVSGTLNSGLSNLVCNGDLNVLAGGSVWMNSDATLRPEIRMANNTAIEINGILSTTWSSPNLKPVITSTAVGSRYSFTVNGRIFANGLIIAGTTNGLNLTDSADKTSDLDNVEFQDVADDTRHLYIGWISGSYVGNYDGCSFDNSFGASGNNVVCTATFGSTVIYFSNWSGAGGGDLYESSGTNTDIIWIVADSILASGPAAIVLELTSAITVPGDFNIEVLTCTGSASVSLTGRWGVVTFSAGTSTVYFEGGTQMITTSNAANSFYNVVVRSSDGVIPSGWGLIIASGGSLTVSPHSATITGSLRTDGGVITLGSGANLVVNSSGRLKAYNSSIITPNPGTDRFSFNISGQIDLSYCSLTSMTTAGLNIQTGAVINNLNNIKFFEHPGSGGCFITSAVAGLNRDFPGCYFDSISTGNYNVSATGSASVLRFETYGAGPGAGEDKDYDDDANNDGISDTGGAVVLWVYKSAIDIGSIQGFPVPAFDLDTGNYYSTYVVSRDISGSNTSDRLYVLDENGNQKYYYEVRQKYGDIIYVPWYYTEDEIHTVYFGTSAGYLFRLIDNGSKLVLSSGFPMKVCSEITTAVISDGVNLYFGGMDGSQARIYAYVISSVTQLFAIGVVSRVSATPSWAINSGVIYLFIGSDMPTPVIYRVNVYAKTIDIQNNTPGNNVRATIVYADWAGEYRALHVGDYDGLMHGVKPFSPSAFSNLSGFPAAGLTYSITAMAYVNYLLPMPTVRIIYADMGGYLYNRNSDGSHYDPGNGPYPILLGGGAPIESAPIVGNGGRIYVGNNDGKVFVIDEATKAVTKTYSLGQGKIGDFGYDCDNSRLLIATSTGEVYYLQD
jgi:hypothetical protein